MNFSVLGCSFFILHFRLKGVEHDALARTCRRSSAGAGPAGASPACTLCVGGSPDKLSTLRQDVGTAKLVLYGTLKDAKQFAGTNGTVDLHIDRVLKSDPFLGEKKVLTLPRIIPPTRRTRPTSWSSATCSRRSSTPTAASRPGRRSWRIISRGRWASTRKTGRPPCSIFFASWTAATRTWPTTPFWSLRRRRRGDRRSGETLDPEAAQADRRPARRPPPAWVCSASCSARAARTRTPTS